MNDSLKWYLIKRIKRISTDENYSKFWGSAAVARVSDELNFILNTFCDEN